MKKYWPQLVILVVVLLAFYPVFGGKVPLNARNLVAFFSPWHYQKFPGFPTGVPSKPGILDQLRIYYPYMRLTQDAYRHGELPLWNPHNFAGNPHMAEWQSGVFYPLHVLLPFLPLAGYWALYQLVGFYLAGWFTYLYLKNLKLKNWPSLFGGLTFMLSSFMTTWNMEVVVTPHSILWLPLVLLAIDKLTNQKLKAKSQKHWWLVGLGGLVFSVLSGYWQTTFYVMVVAAVYALYRIFLITRASGAASRSGPGILIFQLGSWFPLALLLAAFHILPTWELLGRSSRAYINSLPRIQEILLGYLLPIRHLVTLLIPDYYGHPTTRNYFANVGGGWYYEHAIFIGTIPILLVGLALIRGLKPGRRDVWFWALVSLVAGSFSFDLPWSRLVYELKLPVLSTGIANRILLVPAFGLSVLGAVGLEAAGKRRNIRLIRLIGLIGLVGLAAVAAVTYWTRSSFGAEKLSEVAMPTAYITSLRNMVIPTATLGVAVLLLIFATGKKRWLSWALVGVVAVSGAQNLYQHHKFTAFSERMFVYPVNPTISWLRENAGVSRFIGYNGQFLNNNFATQLGIYSLEGYDSLNDHRRSMLVHSSVEGVLDPNLPRSADLILDRNLENPRVIRLMRLFGIRYLVDHPEWIDVGPTEGKPRLPEDEEKLVFEDGDWRIWEYLTAYPRAYLAGSYEVVSEDQNLIDRLYDEDFNPRETLLLSQAPPKDYDFQPDEEAEVEIVSYRPAKIVFKTSSRTDQLLFLSDTWYPGWWYRVDGGDKQGVGVADYALRAVPVPAGEHTVTMGYFPDSFKHGLYVAVAVMIFLAGWRLVGTER